MVLVVLPACWAALEELEELAALVASSAAWVASTKAPAKPREHGRFLMSCLSIFYINNTTMAMLQLSTAWAASALGHAAG